MAARRVRQFKEKRKFPIVGASTEAYVKRYFQLNPQFKPVTYLINGKKVTA